MSLATPVDRTLYFDFMPLRVEPVHGYPVRLQLFTVPGQVYFNATRKLVLTGADGVVFVADSKRDRQDANLESLQNLEANLQEQGRSLSGVPHVMQYNKRDLDSICSVDELNAAGVAYELADGGQTIMVAKDAVYDLRLTMSGKGLPAGQDTGYALLDEQGITTSEFQQQVTYQRALEGELSKTLEALAGVRSAVVHVALPEDEVFVTDQAWCRVRAVNPLA